jgi:hypothetical protein
MGEELISVLKDREHLNEVNSSLRREVEELKQERNLLQRQLETLRRELERINQTKQVVNLCKLMLAWSLVPVASVVLVFALLDGSLYIPSH